MIRRPLPARFAAIALSALSALACQAIFGDYRIDRSELEAILQPCTPGESRCRGARLETCGPDGERWVTVETCASPALCHLGTDSCTPCSPGEYQCNQAALQRCTQSGEWELVDTCATAGLCSLTPDRRHGSCERPACPEAGAYQCSDATLQRCSPELDRWEDIEVCASAELCDADRANAARAAGQPAHCVAPTCRAGEFRCENGVLSACDTGLSGFTPKQTCTPPEHCNVKTGTCHSCTPGEHACSGGELLRCTPAGAWTLVETCASVSLCNAAAGRCDPADCSTPGALRCDRLNLELVRCRTDLREEKLDVCGSANLCNAAEGRCEPPVCRAGEERCAGARHQRCAASLTGWETIETCPADTHCDPKAGCVSGPCQEGAVRCNDRYVEVCAQGRWERRDRCATRELCDSEQGACREPKCAPGEFHCRTEAIVEVCLPGRHAFADWRTCAEGTQCDENSGFCR